ncbi:XdhC family protein [Ochrobactrum sp. Q0168]|uniref:XdhC family protein n=1 Tax=Ochrobactrum sp. Q0168 TaxID=2793241 RepID=UPI0018ED7222|nr:XdhC family protein [Ochrobactrum sp. Q0168]
MQSSLLAELNEIRARRLLAATLTDLDNGRTELVRDAEDVSSALQPHVRQAFETGKPLSFVSENRRYFINIYRPALRLKLVGAVHIAQHLAQMATMTDFDVEIIDPRAAFATPLRFQETALKARWPEEAFRDSPLDRYTAVATLTHDPKIDEPALSLAMRSDCFYIGALGSRRTHAQRTENLLKLGHDATDLARISSPIGLDIGAQTPAEIAVAILAELVQKSKIFSRNRSPLSGDML